MATAKSYNKTIFITYNPNNGLEQTLAARLHTIGAVNDFTIYLPDRFHSNTQLGDETKRRIRLSNYFIVFSFGKLSETVRQEIETAYEHLGDASKIIVIYDHRKGKNLKGDITAHFTTFDFDSLNDTASELAQKIIQSINFREGEALENQLKQAQKEKADSQALNALLGIGLGLFALSALSKNAK